MKKYLLILFATVFCMYSFPGSASAVTYIEDFEDPFPVWESGWLGTNSTLHNYYGDGEGRGNNPDGLWIRDEVAGAVNPTINFLNDFGADATHFEIDIANYSAFNFQVFDMSANLVYSQQINVLNYGATSDPGNYHHISVDLSNGISAFIFSGGYEGYTSIDNVLLTTSASVPEPSTLLLLGSGLVGLGFVKRRFRR